MHLRVDYFDHNETFAALLPRDGQVDRFLKAADGNEWAEFQLDLPIDYEGHRYDTLLLRSRWKGEGLGGVEPTSVFILLVDDRTKLFEGFAVHSFVHVAWGMASTLP